MKILLHVIALIIAATSDLAFCPSAVQAKRINVQAPFDGFVCVRKSYLGCVASAQEKSLQRFRNAYRGSGSEAVRQKDLEGGTTHTADGKYSCQAGVVPYTPQLRMSETLPIVFVSPLLISQIAEQQIRIDRARESCQRYIQAYDYQVEIIAQQDVIAQHDKVRSALQAEIYSERLDRELIQGRPAGQRTLSADEAAATGLPQSTTISQAVRLIDGMNIAQSETIRDRAKHQTLEVDYARSFADAQLLIDSQLRELARELFVLDRAATKYSGRIHVRGYGDGSWVQKGTVVAVSGGLF